MLKNPETRKRVLYISGVGGNGSLINYYRHSIVGGGGDAFFVKKKTLSSSLNEFYHGTPFNKLNRLLFKAFKNIRSYDIIHIHGVEILAPFFKLLHKKVVPQSQV